MKLSIRIGIRVFDTKSGITLRNTTMYDSDVLEVNSILVTATSLAGIKLELLKHENHLNTLAQINFNAKLERSINEQDDAVIDLEKYSWATESKFIDVQVLSK